MHIVLGVISFVVVLAGYLWGKAFLNFVILHPPVATMVSFIVAIAAVIVTQIWFDFRQKRQHKHDIERQETQHSEEWERLRIQYEHDLKAKEFERKQDKAEQIITLEKLINANAFLLCDSVAAFKQNNNSDFLREISKLKVEISGDLAQTFGLIELYFNTISVDEINELNFTHKDFIANLASCLSGTNSNPYDLAYDLEQKMAEITNRTTKELLHFWDRAD
jgi:hypothetical protein